MPTSADLPSEKDIGINDPIDWELDDNNDLIFPLRYVRGNAAIAQRLRVKFRMARGEWFANGDAGFPMLENDFVTSAQAVMGDQFDRTKAEAIFRREALLVIGVSRVLTMQVTFSPSTRELDVNGNVLTVYGDEINVRTSVVLS